VKGAKKGAEWLVNDLLHGSLVPYVIFGFIRAHSINSCLPKNPIFWAYGAAYGKTSKLNHYPKEY